ncbi:MAG: HAD family phosphatase [Alphaproteobacteria bacterium]|nr:HAD family phosphatase [Alphaproteobacteria bacterium]
MSLERPTIVIFDMDGTAVRHLNPRLLSVLEFLDNISYKAIKLFTWLFKSDRKGPIVPEWHDPEWLNENKKKPHLVVHRVLHKVRRKSVEQIVQPSLGLYDVLDFLKANNVPMALVSNGLGKGYGHDILQKFDLVDYFKATTFREDIQHSKPNPEPILLALKRINISIKPEDVIWYIGDHHKDITAAIEANKHIDAKIIPIAFALSAALAAIKKNLSPDHIIMSFHDMFDQLKPMFEDIGNEGQPQQ